MFWKDGVHFVVDKVKDGSHDSCGTTHGGAEKSQEEKISKFKQIFLHNGFHY